MAAMQGGPQPALGAEPLDSSNSLDRPTADLAILDAPDDRTTPLLLVLDAESPAASIARVAIHRRDDAWTPVASTDIELGADDLTARWFVDLGEGRFALVATSPQGASGTGRAVVIGLLVRTEGDAAAIDEGNRQAFDRAIEDSGAADVDGFGSAELVLGLRPYFDSGDCGTSRLVVVDGSVAAVRRSIDIPGPRGAGVLGRFDAMPGDDLLVYITTGCAPGGGVASSLLAIRLADGWQSRAINDELPVFPSTFPPPMLLDIDGSAPDEVIATGAGGLAVFDPSQAWQPTFLGASGSVPLLAGPSGGSGLPGTRVAILDAAGADALVTARLERDRADGVIQTGRSELASDTFDPVRWSVLTTAIRVAGTHMYTSNAWSGGAVEPGCPFVLLPGAVLPCGTDELRSGPAWLATRPVAAMPIGGRRLLLVAVGLQWQPATGLPPSPTPAAVGPAGWWRHGPSAPFALSEIGSDALLHLENVPTPAATIDTDTTTDGTVALPGPTGTRLFTSVTPLLEGRAAPVAATDLLLGLSSWPGAGGRTSVLRVPVSPGLDTGGDGSIARLAIGEVHLDDGQQASRWAMHVVPINDWGEWGATATRTITLDAVAPEIVVEQPFTSPLWPFIAEIHGRSEPGTAVRVDGIGEVGVDARGGFTIKTQLAPWPQAFRVTATDVAGNHTVATFSMVGGVDYRRFPWPAIIAVGLLAVVAARWLFGAEHRPVTEIEASRRASGVADEDLSMPVIEELPPGSGLAQR
jgi:hypothetical protein